MTKSGANELKELLLAIREQKDFDQIHSLIEKYAEDNTELVRTALVPQNELTPYIEVINQNVRYEQIAELRDREYLRMMRDPSQGYYPDEFMAVESRIGIRTEIELLVREKGLMNLPMWTIPNRFYNLDEFIVYRRSDNLPIVL